MPADTKPPFRFWSFFFSPQGRVSRKAIWYFVLPVQGTVLAAQYGISFVKKNLLTRDELLHSGWTYANLWVGLVMLIMVWPIFATLAKRLHDLAVTGAPALLHFLPFVMAIAYGLAAANYALQHDFEATMRLSEIMGIVRLGIDLCVVALILFLAIRRGQSGANRFGADPTGYTVEAVF